MTGNIAPRNSWNKESKLHWHAATKYGSEPVRSAGYADYLYMPSACEDRQIYGMRNSCRELVMPIEKHQPQAACPVAAYCPATAIDAPAASCNDPGWDRSVMKLRRKGGDLQ